MGGTEASLVLDIRTRLAAKVNPKTGTAPAATTIDTYLRFVTNLHKKITTTRMSSFKWAQDTDTVIQTIRENYAPSTQVTVLNALSSCLSVFPRLKKLYTHYYTLMRAGLDTETKERAKTEKNEKQTENHMEWDDIVALRDTLTGVDKVILSLYTMLPPGRVQEYATMKVNGEAVGNVYDTDKQEFQIRKHKTAKSTGDVVVKVPADLAEVLATWLNGRKDGLLLGGLTAPSITKHINKVLGKKIGPNSLRHIYLEKYAPAKKAMKEDATAMRHSTGTQATYIKE